MHNPFHIPIFVYTNNVVQLIERDAVPEPNPLLVLDVEPGNPTVKLTFGRVEGIEVSIKGLEEAIAMAKKVHTGEIRVHA